jgi:Coenzyme PQQ synthesis protein D (PqqD)
MVAFTERVMVPPHVLVRRLDRESVLLNVQTERYFGLDETGTRMWQAVTEAPSIEFAAGRLLEEFDVTPELLRADLMELLSRLVENGLLTLHPAHVETAPAI